MKEHETELSGCGRILDPFQNYGSKMDMETNHITSGWLVRTDCLDVPWFQPQTETIYVDGIPVTWQVSWSREMRNFESLGTVTDIHIHW